MLILVFTQNKVQIKGCIFLNNRANTGEAVYILSSSEVFITNSTSMHNSATVGAAIVVENNPNPSYDTSQILLCSTNLLDVIVKENYCYCGDFNETREGAVYFTGVTVNIGGMSDTGSQFIYNSPEGAIQGVNRCVIQIWGMVTFVNNSGENGGAIS